MRLFLDLAEGKPFDEIKRELAEDIQKLREIREEVRFGPGTSSIIEEAEKRKIPHIRLNSQSLVQPGFGKYQRRIQATVTDRTNMIAVDLASDKDATKNLLDSLGVPVPKGETIRYEEDIEAVLRRIGFPVAVKPLNANHGRGITVGLKTLEEVKTAFAKAKEYSRWVIIEKSLEGTDFRALVINNRLVAVAERQPAHVIGKPDLPIKEIINAPEAINFALRNAKKGELLVIPADNVARTIEIVNNFREEMKPVNIEHDDIPNQPH